MLNMITLNKLGKISFALIFELMTMYNSQTIMICFFRNVLIYFQKEEERHWLSIFRFHFWVSNVMTFHHFKLIMFIHYAYLTRHD